MRLTPLSLGTLDPQTKEAIDSVTQQIVEQMRLTHTDDDRIAHQVFWAYHNQVQSHTTSGNFEAVNFNGEDDLRSVAGLVPWPSGTHDTTTRPDRFIVPGDPGGKARYLKLRVRVSFAANATGSRGIQVSVNDSVVSRPSFVRAASASGATRVTGVASLVVQPGDAVTVEAFQDSGGALDMGGTTRQSANEIELELL